MRGPNLLERLNKGKIIKHNEALHDDGAIVYSYVARKQYFAGRPFMGRLSLVKAVVAHGVASFNAGASHTSDVMNRLSIEHCDHCLPRCKTETEYPGHRHLRNMLRNRAVERR